MNILFISLGCDKNLVDTEVMLGLLASKGHQMVDDEKDADVIVMKGRLGLDTDAKVLYTIMDGNVIYRREV